MTIRVGINGFGRIGRSIFRASKQYKEFDSIEIVAINDLTDNQTLAHMLKYDSVMKTFFSDVQSKDEGITVDGKDIRITAISDPSQLPWQEMGVEYAVEATGKFTDANIARGHLEAGAQKVLITAPAKHEDVTIVMGVNESDYNPVSHQIISNASCTTNCLGPVAKVMQDRFGIISGLITTIHSYTNDQRLLDFPHSDLRRARAAAVNMIPTKTGAVTAISKVMPELRDKFDGLSVRVPTPNVSILDIVVSVGKPTTVYEINEAIKASTCRFLGYTDEPMVSIDFMGDPRSSIVDGGCTKVIQDTLVKVMAWYDNEWGYSNRILDLILYMDAHKIVY